MFKKNLLVLLFLGACGDNIHPGVHGEPRPDSGICRYVGKPSPDNLRCDYEDESVGVDGENGTGSASDNEDEASGPLTPACLMGLIMSGRVPHDCFLPPGR